MNDIDRNPVEPELIAQLRAEFEPAQTAAKERVSRRLTASIGALAMNAPAPRSSTVAARAVETGLSALRAHPGVFFLGFALGTASGAGLVASRRPQPRAEIRSLASPVPERAEVAPIPAIAPAIAASVSVLKLPLRPVSSASASPVASERGSSSHLAEQQALLDTARRALSVGDYSSALQTLDDHFKHYPQSMFAEEREALLIKALAASGQISTARAHAARFRARFPQSLLLPALADSVGQIP